MKKLLITGGIIATSFVAVAALSGDQTYENPTPVISEEVVTSQPIQQKAVTNNIDNRISGTSAAPRENNCHPSYSGCLNPNASDYDCSGGTGDGPYYTGPVQVLGPDVFDLDRDNDGWGCE